MSEDGIALHGGLLVYDFHTSFRLRNFCVRLKSLVTG